MTGKATSNNYKVQFGKNKEIQGLVMMTTFGSNTITSVAYIKNYNRSIALYGAANSPGRAYTLSDVCTYNSESGEVILKDLNNMSSFYYAIW